ncbi:hypothetical protein LTR56_024154 [Elasticomyces elasticus]|nr:hypothetical protein LTR56_024154 [Elasticomyces elasticus]KAK3622272.1 hypothetical protein LTR22_024858 [Elasticomyces elasticus]KAK4906448.1 hypothetical protein LTR49_024417 [Elasticomyces elasticus]KAK5722501.1 hypothetical protein LTR15_005732 [Elasticomyces elasticus]KAK5754869.1 hypothetical protein LTS12_015085 [Elasticomyces elasticus]
MRKFAMPPIGLTLSYILDWIVILAFAAAGGGLNWVSPKHRPFSLLDLSISYPYIPESISAAVVAIISIVAPAIIVFLVVALFVPGPRANRSMTRGQILRLKLWEIEKGWAGLALALATAFFITQGSKNLFGRPRPDLLDRCQPDLSNIAAHAVGGYGQSLSERWVLVSSSICTRRDAAVLDDGFRSFPSGHASFSWSGLLYLTLFLCSKFSIAIPHLPLQPVTADSVKSNEQEMLPLHHDRGNSVDSTHPAISSDKQTVTNPVNIRNYAASPPNYHVVLAFIPVAVALYITSTRFAEFYHHAFDIIVGSLIGIAAASLSFRWYHLPLSRGQGWAWGPRSANRAFGIGVGTGGYVDEAFSRDRSQGRDVEAGRAR